MVSGGLASQPVLLAGLDAPPVNGGPGATPLDGIEVTPDNAAAVPRADGLDQDGLTLS